MTRINRIPAVVALVALIISVPSFAGQQKRRSVTAPGTPVSNTTVKGTVVDDVTGQPVKNVEVAAGDIRTTSDATGRFQLALKSPAQVSLRLSRSGYVAKDVVVAAGSDTTIRITPTKTTRVRMTTGGAEYTLDTESTQFAYASTMSEYPRSDTANFCRSGELYKPHRDTMARIVGPATTTTDSACCDRGPLLKVNVTLKSGEIVEGKFLDSCFGYEMLLMGRDHVTGDYRYLRFTEIAEVIFPQ